MNQFRAEFERLVSRRFFQIMVVTLAVLGSLVVAITAVNSSRPSDAQIRTGQLHRSFVFAQDADDLLMVLMIFVLMIAFLVGASFVGAELTSGAMTNLLLWHPRRLPVLGAKLAALLAGITALSVVSAALFLGALRLMAELVGHSGAPESEAWAELGLTFGRMLVLALLASMLGFALATLGRHTAAALGVATGYLILWEAGGRLMLLVVNAASPERWMLSTWVSAWAAGGMQWRGSLACDSTGGNCTYEIEVITASTALTVLVAVAGVLLAASFASFHRRNLA